MAFTFTNYAALPTQASPLQDILGKVLGGYTAATKARFLKPGLEEALKKAQLYNQYYGPNMESEIGLRGAQVGHLGALTSGQNITNQYLPDKLKAEIAAQNFKSQYPLLGMTGVAGQVGADLYLRQHPELYQSQNKLSPQVAQDQSYVPSINPANQQSQQQQSALLDPQELLLQSIKQSLLPKSAKYAPSNLGKLNQEYSDIQAGFYPNSNRTLPFESPEKQEEVSSTYREKLGGLKTGEHYVYDPETHDKVGIERPYSAKEKEVESGRVFFNDVFPDINNAFKDFIGKGSIRNFNKYVSEYGINPIATQKIDDLLYGQKLIASGVVNEAATLGAGRTNQTYRNLLKSFPTTDIPALLEKYEKEYRIPPEAFTKANIRFQNKINSASKNAIASVPALKKSYFHPEKYLEKTESLPRKEVKNISHYTDEDIRNTAKKYHLTEKEVRERLKRGR